MCLKLRGCGLLVEHHHFGAEGERTTISHGVFCVDREVQQDLLHLAWIDHHAFQSLLQIELDEDLVAHQAFQHFFHGKNSLVHVDNLRLDVLFATECQQLTRQVGCAFRGALNLFKVAVLR